MAAPDDYDLLAFNVDQVADELADVQQRVREARAREVELGIDPNGEDWVNLVALRLRILQPRFLAVVSGAREILHSRPGQAVFTTTPDDLRPPD